ncbi:MAG: hypothetical protein GYA02_05380 [Clostridiaceae bacterium]|jgi:hypothetical protein|nr:hypothetical protein [Clostridiaceae bacterium]
MSIIGSKLTLSGNSEEGGFVIPLLNHAILLLNKGTSSRGSISRVLVIDAPGYEIFSYYREHINTTAKNIFEQYACSG